MFNAIKIAAINSVKGIGGTIVLGIGFTLGAAITRASLEAMSNAANKLADKNNIKKVEKRTAQAVDRVASSY